MKNMKPDNIILLHTSHPPNAHMVRLSAHTWSQPQHKQGVWYATNGEDKVELSDGRKAPFLTWQVFCLSTKSICQSRRKLLGKLYTKLLYGVKLQSSHAGGYQNLEYTEIEVGRHKITQKRAFGDTDFTWS